MALAVLRPATVGAWCALYLFTAAATLLMVIPAPGERDRRDGTVHGEGAAGTRAAVDNFRRGGAVKHGGLDERGPRFPERTDAMIRSATWGVTWPAIVVLVARRGGSLDHDLPRRAVPRRG